jgi:SAM-dependent methyltransferase
MFGMGHEFSYLECDACGSLSCIDVPDNFAPFYPSTYYSFQLATGERQSKRTGLKVWISRRRNEAQIFSTDGLWGLLARWMPRPDLSLAPREIAFFPERNFRCRVLDVGCGDGSWLWRLARAGFRNLTGIDPFMAVEHDEGVRLRRCTLDALSEDPFDVIRFNHSLEHVPDPLASLRAATARLSERGVLIVGTPVAECWLWRTHGVHWVELDAPRHLAIPSVRALTAACERLGLELQSLSWEEDPFGLWATELYLRGMTLVDPKTSRQRDPEDTFSPDQCAGFERRAAELNATGDAGRARFVFRRAA